MKRTEAWGEEAWRTGEAHLTDAVKLSLFIIFGYLITLVGAKPKTKATKNHFIVGNIQK